MEELSTDVDNLLTHSVAADDQQKLHSALHGLFSKLADGEAVVRSIEKHQSQRGL